MSVGVVVPTVPNANDIVLGDVKLIANYELPTQLTLGALDGGIKVNFSRKIRGVNFDGKYGETLDSNGVPLRSYEEFIVKLTSELLTLKYMNNKRINYCESTVDDAWQSGDWTESAGTYTAETTIVAQGDQSAKAVVAANNAGIHTVFSSAKDLTAFDNAEVSATSDYICFAVYITTANIANLGTADIRIAFHKDAELTETNLWYYDCEVASLVNGWNIFKVLKSAFTQSGTASWSAVTGISFKLNAAPSGSTTFYVDAISLMQAQTAGMSLPVNGGAGFTYTDEGDYKKVVGDLEITEDDYYENVCVYGTKFDGKLFLIIIKNVLNDGAIALALKEKTDVIISTDFTGNYARSSPTTVPVEIRDYV